MDFCTGDIDKGIIFNIEDSLEGIVPLNRLNKNEKQKILSIYKEGDTHDVIVQEVDVESKKVILIMDLNGDENKNASQVDGSTVTLEEDGLDKIEIPQEIIDQMPDEEEVDVGSNSADSEEKVD